MSEEWLSISELRPWAKNPRKNDGTPVDKVARSIERFGFVAPIVIWRSAGRMVAGHTRLKALTKLLAADPAFIPKGAPQAGVARVIWHEFESEEEADAYALADNRLNQDAAWDDKLLAEILRGIGQERSKAAGFDDKDITALLDAGEGPPEEDDVPDLPKDPVTKPGDIWLLGKHRLVCGDSCQPAVVAHAGGGGTRGPAMDRPAVQRELRGQDEGRAHH
jgi:ParB-like chromosome segregation protein Spo0J